MSHVKVLNTEPSPALQAATTTRRLSWREDGRPEDDAWSTYSTLRLSGGGRAVRGVGGGGGGVGGGWECRWEGRGGGGVGRMWLEVAETS